MHGLLQRPNWILFNISQMLLTSRNCAFLRAQSTSKQSNKKAQDIFQVGWNCVAVFCFLFSITNSSVCGSLYPAPRAPFLLTFTYLSSTHTSPFHTEVPIHCGIILPTLSLKSSFLTPSCACFLVPGDHTHPLYMKPRSTNNKEH